jgi:hypothetical protein
MIAYRLGGALPSARAGLLTGKTVFTMLGSGRRRGGRFRAILHENAGIVFCAVAGPAILAFA